jgi:hypothetical protein
MNNNDDDLDELVKQLKKDSIEIKKIQKKPHIDINDDNINDYIMKKVGSLVENGVDTIDVLKESVLAGGDSKDIESFSELYKAVTGALDVLNKINIQNKKSKITKEIKQMDIEQRQLEGPKSNNTNILVATREEIIKGFLCSNKKIIEAQYDESDKSDEIDEINENNKGDNDE